MNTVKPFKNLNPEDEEDAPVVDPEKSMMMALLFIVIFVLAVWCTALYFFAKSTLFFSFILAVAFTANRYELIPPIKKEILTECGVKLDQE
ncbi:MAG: hypothetical protein WCT07_02365 [Candidatus Paceibacterota bacterium]|jgi:hypothetical protein